MSMTLQQLFDDLSHGELSQTHIGGNADQAGIWVENQAIILSHINLGLTALHRRFNLKEGRIRVLCNPEREHYVLSRDHAASNPEADGEAIWVIDDGLGFQNDLLKVERIETRHPERPDEPLEVTLNTEGSWWNIDTPSFNTLRVPAQLRNAVLTVTYRADHPRIIRREDQVFLPEQIMVEIPHSHHEALLHYVASRVISPLGQREGYHEGNDHAAKFERACQMLENQGMDISRHGDESRFRRNGWV